MGRHKMLSKQLFRPHNLLCRGRKIAIYVAFFFQILPNHFITPFEYLDILVTMPQLAVRPPGSSWVRIRAGA